MDGLLRETVDLEVSRASAYLAQIETIRNSFGGAATGSPWIFGGHHPTALDASIVVFLVRMQGVGRGSIIPATLLQMVEVGGSTKEFEEIYSSL